MKSIIIITIALAVTFMACDEPIELTTTTTNTVTNTVTKTGHPQGFLISNHTISIKGTDYTFLSNTEMKYYSDGNIREGYLASNVTVNIRGTDYTFKSDDDITFYHNQNIKIGRLASNVTVTIRGTNYTFGIIIFYNNQNIHYGWLRSNVTVTIRGTNYTFASRQIQFHTTEAVIQGRIVGETAYTQFYTDGTTNAVKQGDFDRAWTGALP